MAFFSGALVTALSVPNPNSVAIASAFSFLLTRLVGGGYSLPQVNFEECSKMFPPLDFFLTDFNRKLTHFLTQAILKSSAESS